MLEFITADTSTDRFFAFSSRRLSFFFSNRLAFFCSFLDDFSAVDLTSFFRFFDHCKYECFFSHSLAARASVDISSFYDTSWIDMSTVCRNVVTGASVLMTLFLFFSSFVVLSPWAQCHQCNLFSKTQAEINGMKSSLNCRLTSRCCFFLFIFFFSALTSTCQRQQSLLCVHLHHFQIKFFHFFLFRLVRFERRINHIETSSELCAFGPRSNLRIHRTDADDVDVQEKK